MCQPHVELGIILWMLAERNSRWSQSTFGLDRELGPLSALRQLEKKAREAQGTPTDPSEYADCLLLILDAARRVGLTPKMLLVAARSKMAINENRRRSKPVADQPVEHVRSETA